MPIIGHTLVGIVVAQHVRPGAAAHAHAPAWTRALWMPAIVALSYLPDVLTQLGVWLELRSAQAAGHSMPVACVFGVVLGWCWSRVTRTPCLRSITLVAVVILLHDSLDLFQDVERMPLWPFSHRQAGVDWLRFNDRLTGEAVAFGLPFMAYQLWRLATSRPLSGTRSNSAMAQWTTAAFVLVVIGTTIGVVHLRERRESQMSVAELRLQEGRLDEALAAIDAAVRWPSSSAHGDLLRGRVYLRMGDDIRAEHFFDRAYSNNPDGFWTVAALAEFHASRGPTDTRRARSAPYVEVLRARFAGHDAFRDVMSRIERGWSDSE